MKINRRFFIVFVLALFFSMPLFSAGKTAGGPTQYPNSACLHVKQVKKASLIGVNFYIRCINGYKSTCRGSIKDPWNRFKHKFKVVWVCNYKDRYEFSSKSKDIKKFKTGSRNPQFKSVCDAIDLVGDPLCKKHQ